MADIRSHSATRPVPTAFWMDKIRISKVEDVAYSKAAVVSRGTIHLTAHHLIFQFDNDSQKEMWVPYPLISLVTRLPQTLQGQCPVTFHCRTFEFFSLAFAKESDALDVFESVKELTVAPSVYQLYAFFYTPNPPLPTRDGWLIYSPREEFGRMGVGTRSKAWRFTDINKDYAFSPTYPARLVVPTKISDTTLQYASKYRSKCRIPVLTYLHWSGYGSIARSSQPMVGITQNRSIQDEKLIEAVFQSHFSPESRVATAQVYGATTTNLIIDARPTTNAMANTAKGAGTENMDHYKDSKKVYLGIDHIHTMRDSLAKVVEALRDADALLSSINNDLSGQLSNISVLDRQALRRSGWLRHISAILEGTVLIAKNVHVSSSHVLIHCSDGWDRTSQLSALAQLCLDPFYRTIKGFEILVEKDWVSFGHKFLDRCGHLSSDKFFVTPTEQANSGGGADAAQAFLASVQNRFASQSHVKETSPVFHQFLESVRQIQRQFPNRFEFNERFLRQLYYHLYSCQFGTFLFNSERERRVSEDGELAPFERTVSVWDFFNSPPEMEQNLNPEYDPSLDDPSNRSSKSDMGVLLPNPKDVRFWNELYGRSDEEMNGRLVSPQVRGPEIVGPMDGPEKDAVIQRSATPSKIPLPPSPSPTTRLTLPLSSVSEASTSTLNEIVIARPAPSREESFTPFASTSSAFSLKPTVPASPSILSPPSPSNRSNQKATDFFSNTNVKSMWGRLSSNASAAFSAVQEVYEGAPKPSPSPSKTQELQSRDTLNTWINKSRHSPPPTSYSTPTISTNPWASASISPTDQFGPLAVTDNPWQSIRVPSQKQEQYASSASLSTLPLDPTVSALAAVSSPSLETPVPKISARRPQFLEEQRSISDTSAPTSLSSTDPLGVGLS